MMSSFWLDALRDVSDRPATFQRTDLLHSHTGFTEKANHSTGGRGGMGDEAVDLVI
jgi:hypothetical protein